MWFHLNCVGFFPLKMTKPSRMIESKDLECSFSSNCRLMNIPRKMTCFVCWKRMDSLNEVAFFMIKCYFPLCYRILLACVPAFLWFCCTPHNMLRRWRWFQVSWAHTKERESQKNSYFNENHKRKKNTHTANYAECSPYHQQKRWYSMETTKRTQGHTHNGRARCVSRYLRINGDCVPGYISFLSSADFFAVRKSRTSKKKHSTQQKQKLWTKFSDVRAVLCAYIELRYFVLGPYCFRFCQMILRRILRWIFVQHHTAANQNEWEHKNERWLWAAHMQSEYFRKDRTSGNLFTERLRPVFLPLHNDRK